MLNHGYELIVVKQLDRPPRLEKDTFSGGYYVEARARNMKRLADWDMVYVKHDTKQIFGRTAIIEKLLRALGPPPPPPPKEKFTISREEFEAASPNLPGLFEERMRKAFYSAQKSNDLAVAQLFAPGRVKP